MRRYPEAEAIHLADTDAKDVIHPSLATALKRGEDNIVAADEVSFDAGQDKGLDTGLA